MTDRVPGAPGQYKAVIQTAELDKLQNGESFTITLTRDDQPITEGTPYSKAAVLPDELAAVICPEVADPAPKDAFEALADRQIESAEYPGCCYRYVNGVQEWINPPMLAGVPYRTTERYGGLPVYCQHVSYTTTETVGTSGSRTDFEIAHGISGFKRLVRVDGRHDGTFPVNLITSGGNNMSVSKVDSTDILLRLNGCAFDARTWKFNVYYTKE